MKIFCVFFNEKLREEQYKKLFNFLSLDERKQINKFKKWEDAQRALIGRILIRSIVCNHYSFKNYISFQINEYGKPFLKELPDIHFNIAHSGCWVVCAIDNDSVGIDVERIQPIDLNIAKRFFSMEECADLYKKEEKDRLSYFFDLWTLKESYIKAEGKGLSIPLDSFTIRKEKGSIRLIGENKSYYFKQYEISNEYRLSVASTSNNFPTKHITFDLDTFIEFTMATLRCIV
jgi:4'-phosphopantetheinyl transferase